MSEGYDGPLPTMRPVDRPYWKAGTAGELRLQRCSDCGKWRFPPADLCPNCLSERYAWEQASGTGTLWAWVVIHREYFSSFRGKIPYNVAFIQLDEGPYLMSSIVGTEPADLAVGDRVEVLFERADADIAIPRFRTAEAGLWRNSSRWWTSGTAMRSSRSTGRRSETR
jgi:uncharacterized protein